MPWAYFDTSALIKRYVDERGRRDVLQLLRHRDCVTSAVLPVEVRGALRRRAGDGSISSDGVREILRRLDTDREFWTVIEVSRDVLGGAETLIGVHPLRALDAIHLASAQLFARRVAGPELIFVSADERQTMSAAAAGMTVRLIPS